MSQPENFKIKGLDRKLKQTEIDFMKVIEEQNFQRVLKLKRTRRNNLFVGKFIKINLSSSFFNYLSPLQLACWDLVFLVSTGTLCSQCNRRNSLTTLTSPWNKKFNSKTRNIQKSNNNVSSNRTQSDWKDPATSSPTHSPRFDSFV